MNRTFRENAGALLRQYRHTHSGVNPYAPAIGLDDALALLAVHSGPNRVTCKQANAPGRW
jgi:hypothetical protein